MHQMMVERTQQDQVVEIGRAVVEPVNDVMCMQTSMGSTPRKLATVRITPLQLSAKPAGDNPLTQTNSDRIRRPTRANVGARAGLHGDQGVATEPTDHLIR